MQLCSTCGGKYGDGELLWRCACGGVLDFVWGDAGPSFDQQRIASGPRSIYRYREALPLPPDVEPVSLGEGLTPLVPANWHGQPVHLKLDYLCPSGSFKDRGASLLVTKLRAAGVSEMLEDSSGNAGAALAAYAAAAGMRCHIYVPAATSAGKAVQIAAAGAALRRVPGSREDTKAAALAAAGTMFYASHNWVPWFLQGTKTAAFELWEQLGWRLPDVVVCPTGYGSYLLGLYLGFCDLRRAGATERLPRLVAAQAANVAPLVAALNAGLEHVPAVPKQPTTAEGIAGSEPVRGRLMLEAVRVTGGTAVAVTEREIAAAVLDLARKGFYVEPSAAVGAAAVSKLVADRVVAATDNVVVVLTGAGLKATETIGQMLI